MEELTDEQKIQEQKDFIQKEIDGLEVGKKFPETVKKLISTPEWNEVINEVYMDGFAKDLVRNYENYDEEQQAIFDEEYKVRSRFFNTLMAWAEGADKANEQIARYREMLESVGKEEQAAKEPTIATK